MPQKVSGAYHGNLNPTEIKKERKWLKGAKRASAVMFMVLAVGLVVRTFASSVVFSINAMDAINAQDPNIEVSGKYAASTESSGGKKPTNTNTIDLGGLNGSTPQQGTVSYYAKFNPGIYEVCMSVKPTEAGSSGSMYIADNFSAGNAYGVTAADFYEPTGVATGSGYGKAIPLNTYQDVCGSFSVSNSQTNTKFKITIFNYKGTVRLKTISAKTTTITTDESLLEKASLAQGTSVRNEGSPIYNFRADNVALMQETNDGITQKVLDVNANNGSLTGNMSVQNGELKYQLCVVAKPIGGPAPMNFRATSTEAGNYALQKFTSTGSYVSQIGAYGDGVGQLATPLDSATDANGNTYTAGLFEGQFDFNPTTGTDVKTAVGGADVYFTKWSSNGTYQWTRTIGGSDTDRFGGIALDASGNVLISGSFQNTVNFNQTGSDVKTSKGRFDQYFSKWTSDGNYVFTTAYGEMGGDDESEGIAVDPAGNILMLSYGSYSKFSSTGTYIGTIGAWGQSDGQLFFARSIATDKLGNVYVAQSDKIQRFDANGAYVSKIVPDATQFDYVYARSIAIDASNNVYALVNSYQIGKYSPTGAQLGKVALPTDRSFDMSDISIDKTGSLYLINGFNKTSDVQWPSTTMTSLEYAKRCLPVNNASSPFLGASSNGISFSFSNSSTKTWRVKSLFLEPLETDMINAFKYRTSYPQFQFSGSTKIATDIVGVNAVESIEVPTGQSIQYNFTPTGSATGLYSVCFATKATLGPARYVIGEYGNTGGAGNTKTVESDLANSTSYANRCTIIDTKTNGPNRTVNFTAVTGTFRVNNVSVQPLVSTN